MLGDALNVFILTIVVVAGLSSMGIVAGLLVAWHKERQYLKIVNGK